MHTYICEKGSQCVYIVLNQSSARDVCQKLAVLVRSQVLGFWKNYPATQTQRPRFRYAQKSK